MHEPGRKSLARDSVLFGRDTSSFMNLDSFRNTFDVHSPNEASRIVLPLSHLHLHGSQASVAPVDRTTGPQFNPGWLERRLVLFAQHHGYNIPRHVFRAVVHALLSEAGVAIIEVNSMRLGLDVAKVVETATTAIMGLSYAEITCSAETTAPDLFASMVVRSTKIRASRASAVFRVSDPFGLHAPSHTRRAKRDDSVHFKYLSENTEEEPPETFRRHSMRRATSFEMVVMPHVTLRRAHSDGNLAHGLSQQRRSEARQGLVDDRFSVADVCVINRLSKADSNVALELAESIVREELPFDGGMCPLPRNFAIVLIVAEDHNSLPQVLLDRVVASVRASASIARPPLIAQPEPVLPVHVIACAREACLQVHVSTLVERYARDIVVVLRNHKAVAGGVAARLSGLHLLSMARIIALINGDTFVHPRHVAAAAETVFSHRIVLKPWVAEAIAQAVHAQRSAAPDAPAKTPVTRPKADSLLSVGPGTRPKSDSLLSSATVPPISGDMTGVQMSPSVASPALNAKTPGGIHAHAHHHHHHSHIDSPIDLARRIIRKIVGGLPQPQ
eukprot:Opistho-1_new@65806